jgi:hypothetical protein
MAKRRKSKSSSRKTCKPSGVRHRKNRSLEIFSQTNGGHLEIAHGGLAPAQLPASNKSEQDSKSQFLAAFHPQLLGNVAYFCLSKSMSLTGDLLEAAAPAVLAFQERMRPTDALEELALSQALITHARAAWLSTLAIKQTNAQSLAVMNEAADRASSTFARLMRAIREHRKPTNPSTTVSIAQANVAAQQIVQNIPGQESQKNHDEQTGIPGEQATVTASVQAIDEGIAVAPNGHQTNEAVDKKHRATKPRRKGSGSDERT